MAAGVHQRRRTLRGADRNKIKLDVNPFGGVLEKARNDLRGGGGAYDAVLLDTQWTIEMYEGGFLVPFQEIDPAFAPPKELLTYDDSGYWNEQKRWRTAKGGKLMAFTVLGNVPVWYYRDRRAEGRGHQPPKTIPEVLASCAKLTKPPATYGAVVRAERGNGIRYEWLQWMLSRGGTVVRDPENGDYTVTVNSPQNKAALDDFIEVTKKCGVPNPGSIGQGDVIQLLATGKALQAQLVLAAWAQLPGPEEIGGRRQDRRRADPARRRRQDRRGDRQLELRDPEGRQRRTPEGGARIREVAHELRRADTRSRRRAAFRTAATC